MMDALDALRCEVDVLKDALHGSVDPWAALGLTPAQSCIFGVMMRRDVATHDAIVAALYSSRLPEDIPDPTTHKALIHYMRKRLRVHGIEVETRRPSGWRLSPAAKARARSLTSAA